MSNDDAEAEQTPASPTNGSHDQVVPPVAMEGIVVTPPTSSHTQKYSKTGYIYSNCDEFLVILGYKKLNVKIINKLMSHFYDLKRCFEFLAFNRNHMFCKRFSINVKHQSYEKMKFH